MSRPMTIREEALIRAGLRLLQRARPGNELPPGVRDILEYAWADDASSAEIDELCAAVNFDTVTLGE